MDSTFANLLLTLQTRSNRMCSSRRTPASLGAAEFGSGLKGYCDWIADTTRRYEHALKTLLGSSGSMSLYLACKVIDLIIRSGFCNHKRKVPGESFLGENQGPDQAWRR